MVVFDWKRNKVRRDPFRKEKNERGKRSEKIGATGKDKNQKTLNTEDLKYLIF